MLTEVIFCPLGDLHSLENSPDKATVSPKADPAKVVLAAVPPTGRTEEIGRAEHLADVTVQEELVAAVVVKGTPERQLTSKEVAFTSPGNMEPAGTAAETGAPDAGEKRVAEVPDTGKKAQPDAGEKRAEEGTASVADEPADEERVARVPDVAPVEKVEPLHAEVTDIAADVLPDEEKGPVGVKEVEQVPDDDGEKSAVEVGADEKGVSEVKGKKGAAEVPDAAC